MEDKPSFLFENYFPYSKSLNSFLAPSTADNESSGAEVLAIRTDAEFWQVFDYQSRQESRRND